MNTHDLHWKTIHSVTGHDPTIDPAGVPTPGPIPGPEPHPVPPAEDPYPQKPGDSPEPAPLPDEVDHQQDRDSEQLIERAGFHAESMADQNQSFEKYSFRTVWR